MQCKYTADTAYDAFCNYNCTGSIHSLSYTSLPAVRAQLCCTASADSESLSQQRTQLHKAQFSPTVIQEPGNHCHCIPLAHPSSEARNVPQPQKELVHSWISRGLATSAFEHKNFTQFLVQDFLNRNIIS